MLRQGGVVATTLVVRNDTSHSNVDTSSIYHKTGIYGSSNSNALNILLICIVCVLLFTTSLVIYYTPHSSNDHLKSDFLNRWSNSTPVVPTLVSLPRHTVGIDSEIAFNDKNESPFVNKDEPIISTPEWKPETERDLAPVISPEVLFRKDSVRNATIFAWNAYSSNCFGQDDFNPVHNKCENWLNLGLTLVDSLDTLLVMNLEKEYQKARDWIVNSLSVTQNKDVSVFETIIRIVGGLLAAYELTGETDYPLIEKAVELTDRLNSAFGTSSGMPRSIVNLASGHSKNYHWAANNMILAEVGTMQLEYVTLSYYSQKPEYKTMAYSIMEKLRNAKTSIPGLYPIYLNEQGGFSGSHYSIAGLGDSFYEYILKLWLLGDRKEAKYRQMYLLSANGIIKNLLKTSTDGYLYAAQLQNGRARTNMDHLACFFPGVLALGVQSGATSSSEEAEQHLNVAKELARTCHAMYSTTLSKLAPESTNFNSHISVGNPTYYLLRPETVESLFILWRVTHKPEYRDMAWDIFRAIEDQCRRDNGYAPIGDVRKLRNQKEGRMESFLIAETFKYLYLIFSEDDVLPLDKVVFNTEAHPFKIRPEHASS